jgi:outer membrane lipopolysaccharide assembly protein LptE/RlpB
MKKIASLILVCIFSVQCGYHLRGTGSSLPAHIEKVEVPMFVNNTTRYELDIKLTQGVIDEFIARGKVEVTSDSGVADATLLGEIISYRVIPIAFSDDTTADRYNIMIVAKITLRDRINNRIIFSNDSFVYQEAYEVPQDTDFDTVETEAIDRVAEKFARSLIISILEGF